MKTKPALPKNYLARYQEAANFFNLTEFEKEQVIKKRAWSLLPEKIQKIFNKQKFIEEAK